MTEESLVAESPGGGVGTGVAESVGRTAEILASSSAIASGGKMPTTCCAARTGISACQLATAAQRRLKPERPSLVDPRAAIRDHPAGGQGAGS